MVIFGYYIEDTPLMGDAERAPKSIDDDIEWKTVNPQIPTTLTLTLNTDPVLEIPDEEELEYHGN
jgi:hypothetical protein